MAFPAVLLSACFELSFGILTARVDRPAGYFGVFAEAESSFDIDADGEVRNGHIQVLDGLDPLREDNVDSGLIPAKYFHESRSADSWDAWASHYPSLDSGVGSSSYTVPKWMITEGGTWVQDYVSAVTGSDRHPQWFDSSVSQYDGFGRLREPDPGSPRSYLPWVERSNNVTLLCPDAGCLGSSILFAFDPEIEEARNCQLSFPVHPTDFDDQFSGERIEFIDVNGARVNVDCFPLQHSCNDTYNPMFDCVRQYPVDTLLNRTHGDLYIVAKISDVVDECAFEGNLLSAVPQVTCMVRPLQEHETQTFSPKLPVIESTCEIQEVTLQNPLTCAERGCTAHTQLSYTEPLQECYITVTLNQTDFDGDLGSWEAVEWLQVSGVTMIQNVTPGGNPCACSNSSHPMVFTLVEDENVTDYFLPELLVEAKITDLVDECSSNGWLLDGLVTVTCLTVC
mmetsp:Transcript_36428/g.96892  ORF Transcript_36428/g.96892 Transcript_36428/m.96892 type:complete len:453 (-) Transcript_36428:100-1458(-)